MSDLIASNIIWFQAQKQLTALNNIRELLKSVLTDLCACNFVHAKIFLRSRCMHVRHRVRNLSNPEMRKYVSLKLLQSIYFAIFKSYLSWYSLL